MSDPSHLSSSLSISSQLGSPVSPSAARSASGVNPPVGGSGSQDPDDFVEDLENDGDPELDEELEGEDLEENALRDYERIAELDEYEAADLDDQDYDIIDEDERRQAERQMRRRDEELARQQGRQPAALDSPIDEDEDDDDQAGDAPKKRRRIREGETGEAEELSDEQLQQLMNQNGMIGVDDAEGGIDLDSIVGPVSIFLASESTRQEIRRRFTLFLHRFRLDGHQEDKLSYYQKQLKAMVKVNATSLVVSFEHLSVAGDENGTSKIAQWIADEPETLLEVLNEAAYAYTLHLYPQYKDIASAVYVRIEKLPVIDHIRDLRQLHLRSFVKVEGVVTRRTSVFPQLQSVKYNCLKCGTILGPFTQNDSEEIKVRQCSECTSTGPFSVNAAETIYRNYQKITLQESPGTVPAGRVPRTKDIILLNDLIDSVSPGEMIEVTGIYKHTYDRQLNQQNGFPVFSTLIIANYIQNHKELMDTRLTEDDIDEIRHLAKDPQIAERIFASIAPSIYGHTEIKQALTLALFGGSEKLFENGHRIRGDINVLLLGDPGTAKSQFLKHVEQISHRSVYTTGKGASAVGLTASVHRDVLTREWVLEGGALVLADQGVCCIDEFDKMNDQDRTSIHEAMEQQSISISKAGIVTTLKARCSVIAAANPVTGRYNSAVSFSENVELTDAILSRFDLLCVVRDTVDRDNDARLAAFVVNSHINGHPNKELVADEPTTTTTTTTTPPVSPYELIPTDLLSKYIYYAKLHSHPILDQFDDDRVAKLYAKLRHESFLSGGLPISVRHIESLIRMSEAHCKMCLRNHVNTDDINFAIKMMIESFIKQQKFSVMRSLKKGFDSYLIQSTDTDSLLLFTLKNMVNEQLTLRELQRRNNRQADGVDEYLSDVDDEDTEEEQEKYKKPIVLLADDMSEKIKELNISEPILQVFYRSDIFNKNGFLYNKQNKQIIKNLS